MDQTLIFRWPQPAAQPSGQAWGYWDPTSNIVTWRWQNRGTVHASINDVGTSSDSISAQELVYTLGCWITTFPASDTFAWQPRLRRVFVADNAISSDSFTAGIHDTSITIIDLGVADDFFTVSIYAVEGQIVDNGISSDVITGSPTGIVDVGSSQDLITAHGALHAHIQDDGTSDDRFTGHFRVGIIDNGSSSDLVFVHVGRSVVCNTGDGVAVIPEGETNYVF